MPKVTISINWDMRGGFDEESLHAFTWNCDSGIIIFMNFNVCKSEFNFGFTSNWSCAFSPCNPQCYYFATFHLMS